MNQFFISKRTIPKKYTLIRDIDDYFNYKVGLGSIKLNKKDMEFLHRIDKSILTKEEGYMNTPFANHVMLDKCSTGVKTLILLNHAQEDEVVDISQCGDNVIEIIFNELDNKKFYTSVFILPDNIKYEVQVNNRKKICKTSDDIGDIWDEFDS